MTRKNRRSQMDYFDKDYIFRPDLPNVRYVINLPRKTVFINLDADPEAVGIRTISYEDGGA